MLPSKIRMRLETLILICILAIAYGQDRKIKSYLNPGCIPCRNSTILIYVRAEGNHDTLHQVWDFTSGIPTGIFAVAGVNSSLSITWTNNKPIKFKMTETPKYSFALAIDKLIEYNDVKDIGRRDPNMPSLEHRLKSFTWRLEDIALTADEARVRVRGHREHASDVVEVTMDYLPFEDYGSRLPHLIHTANSTQWELSLVNLTTAPQFNSSRFAAHLVMVSTDPVTERLTYTVKKILDDEHTPGVFEMMEICTPESGEAGGFAQFRPVAYTERARTVGGSTGLSVTGFRTVKLPSHTLEMFYEEQSPLWLVAEDVEVAFGEAADGFYRQHNYTVWSFTLGYGSPPAQSSLFVLVLAGVGLAVPAVLACSGLAYVAARRLAQRRASAPLVRD